MIYVWPETVVGGIPSNRVAVLLFSVDIILVFPEHPIRSRFHDVRVNASRCSDGTRMFRTVTPAVKVGSVRFLLFFILSKYKSSRAI